MPIDVPAAGARLDILVENSGRVNFTTALREERKGITHSVTLAGRELTGWDVVTLPMSTGTVRYSSPHSSSMMVTFQPFGVGQ